MVYRRRAEITPQKISDWSYDRGGQFTGPLHKIKSSLNVSAINEQTDGVLHNLQALVWHKSIHGEMVKYEEYKTSVKQCY